MLALLLILLLLILLFGGLGLFVAIYAATHYPLGTALRMGPGYFPAGVGGIVALLGLVLTASLVALTGRRDPRPLPTPKPPKEKVPMSPATEPYPRRWKALGVLALSLLVITMGNTILNVGLPTIREELDASSSQLQWIVDSYLLVFAGFVSDPESGPSGLLPPSVQCLDLVDYLERLASSPVGQQHRAFWETQLAGATPIKLPTDLPRGPVDERRRLHNGYVTFPAGALVESLDARATAAMRLRMETVSRLAEELFLLQTLGDDRAVVEVYVAGKPAKSALAA